MATWNDYRHSWEAYVDAQEMPEECPVCGADVFDEDEDAPVYNDDPAFCSEECAHFYRAESLQDAIYMDAEFLDEAEALTVL